MKQEFKDTCTPTKMFLLQNYYIKIVIGQSQLVNENDF
jgi:hypothetical protein